MDTQHQQPSDEALGSGVEGSSALAELENVFRELDAERQAATKEPVEIPTAEGRCFSTRKTTPFSRTIAAQNSCTFELERIDHILLRFSRA